MGKRERGEGLLGTKAAEEKRETEREKRRRIKKRKMGGGQGPFNRDYNDCIQLVLLVTAAEGIMSPQDTNDRPVQMPEYDTVI